MTYKEDCFAYDVTECTALYNLECEGCKFYKSRQKKQEDDFKTIERLIKIGTPKETLKKVAGYRAYIKL